MDIKFQVKLRLKLHLKLLLRIAKKFLRTTNLHEKLRLKLGKNSN